MSKKKAEQVEGAEVEAVESIDEGMPQNQAALDALAAQENEEQQAEAADSGVAEEVSSADDKKLAARLDQEAKKKAAAAGAAMAVGFMETMVKARAPYVEIGADSRGQLIESLAPVLEKHQTGMPDWLVPYQEEFKFCMSLGGVAFGVWLQVQAHQAQQQQAAEKEKEGSQ